MQRLASFIAINIVMIGALFAELPPETSYEVGVESIDYYPHYAFENGELVGFARRLFDAFAEWKGIEFRYKAYPVKRLDLAFLNKDFIDFRYPANPKWDEKYQFSGELYYSHPIVAYTDGAVVLDGNKGRGIAAIDRLGTIRGFNPFPYLGFIKEGRMDVVEVSTFESLLEMVRMQRVDAAYINVEIAQYLIGYGATDATRPLIYDPALPHTNDHYHLSTRKFPGLLADFNRFLETEKSRVDDLKHAMGLGDARD